MIQEESGNTDGAKRAKTHLELNLARDVKAPSEANLRELQAPEAKEEIQTRETYP